MIEFKIPKLRVRCLECKKEHFIDMKLINSDKVQHSISFEYEYTYGGELKCSCGDIMKLETIIFEYPKGILNYHETGEESCLVMDELTDDSFNVL
jgi:hypothetical protein